MVILFLSFCAMAAEPTASPWLGFECVDFTRGTTPLGAQIIKRYPIVKNPELQVGTVISQVNGQRVKDQAEFRKAVAKLVVGSECSLGVTHGGRLTIKAPVFEQAEKTRLDREAQEAALAKQAEAERQRAEAEAARAEEIKRHGPLKVVGARMGRNTIGERTLMLDVKNISTEATIAFEAAIYCYNRLDDPVPGIGNGSHRQSVLGQDTIPAGKTWGGRWTLHFRDATAKVRVVIHRVKYADGTRWEGSDKEAGNFWEIVQ